MPKEIKLEYKCHKCRVTMSDGNRLRAHLFKLHGQIFPASPSGKRRRNNDKYTYSKEGVRHFACPSCLQHFAFIPKLREHIEENHKVGEGDNSFILETSGAVMTFADANTVSGKEVPYLDSASLKSMQKNSRVVTSFNPGLDEEERSMLTSQRKEQQVLESLQRFPSTRNLLTSLIETNDFTKWPNIIWSFELILESELEACFFQAAQYILTDFANKCQRNAQFFNPKYERTFFIDKVIPLFQTIGDQSGFMGHEWCEVEPIHYKRYTINKEEFKRTSTRYLDGKGMAQQKYDVAIFECSSGLQEDRSQHVIDDTVKTIHTSHCLIDHIINDNANANFNTICGMKMIIIHTNQENMSLCTSYLDKNKPGKHVYVVNRNAKIPININDKNDLVTLLELLAYYTLIIYAQQDIFDTLSKERNGLTPVHRDQTVAAIIGL